MIKLSLKGLAKFMIANASQQRKILKDYKFPKPEGQAQAIYYNEAKSIIKTYHKSLNNKKWLDSKSESLMVKANQSQGHTTNRLKHNARAVSQYAKYFGKRKFNILSPLFLKLQYHGVTITITPDLHVREKGKEKIIKLDFMQDKPNTKLIRIISQAMFEAQLNFGINLSSSAVLYIDVPRGVIHKGARTRSRMQKEIEDACRTIADIWNGI